MQKSVAYPRRGKLVKSVVKSVITKVSARKNSTINKTNSSKKYGRDHETKHRDIPDTKGAEKLTKLIMKNPEALCTMLCIMDGLNVIMEHEENRGLPTVGPSAVEIAGDDLRVFVTMSESGMMRNLERWGLIAPIVGVELPPGDDNSQIFDFWLDGEDKDGKDGMKYEIDVHNRKLEKMANQVKLAATIRRR